MADDQLRSALDTLRARFQAELDAQLELLAAQQQDALAAARAQTEADAEQRWASKVEAMRGEWASRLESELAAARNEAERHMVAESMRLRVEADQATAESVARVREEVEQALGAERQRAHAELEAERQRAARELDAERQRLEAALTAEPTQAAVTEAHATERQSQLASVERLFRSVAAISRARSLSAILTELVHGAAAEGTRAALFMVDGDQLRLFNEQGFVNALSLATPVAADGILGEALRRGDAVSATDARDVPSFACLSADRAALAVPLIAGGYSVAVLYADDGRSGDSEAPAAWPEAIQVLVRHAAACAAFFTLLRTSAALSMRTGEGPLDRDAHADDAGVQSDGPSDEESSARRYARLLVSEIKLYNEAAVRAGRQKRDLMDRLRPEIERARRLYEERVPPAVGARIAYFQQELVQTLADGDSSLLGG
jgi:putative methionine-R-sulfoxide reductase with GAF domain